MIRPRPLVCVAAFLMSVASATAVATAQTVIVRRAPAGGTVDIVMGPDVLGSGTADPLGDASVTLKTFPRAPATEMSLQVFIDVCGAGRRVVLVERSFQAPAVALDCLRRAIAGFYAVRPISTLVIDVGDAVPTLRIRQGPAPAAWLRHGPPPPPSLFSAAPGLELFGAATFVTFREAVGRSCGTVRGCAGKDFTPSFAAGAAYWVSPYFGAHASNLRAGTVNVSATGPGFRFDTAIDVEALTIGGIVGVPIGRTRLYGHIGANRHRAAAVTVETTDDAVVIVDGVPRTIPGGTETFVLNTAGWGWQFGGGFDLWLTPAFALFVEGGSGPIKGTNRDTPEGVLDDHITFVLIGGRVRLSGLFR
jgi:hypothetical protein